MDDAKPLNPSKTDCAPGSGPKLPLAVCGRCFFACEIRRLARTPFPAAAAEVEAVEALEECDEHLLYLIAPRSPPGYGACHAAGFQVRGSQQLCHSVGTDFCDLIWPLGQFFD